MNTVRDFHGNIIGFRCWTCGEVKSKMWGTECNACREKEKQTNEITDEIGKLRIEVSKLKNILKTNK